MLWERSSIYQHIYQVHNKVSMEQYGKLMLDYKHDPAPAPSTKAAARPGGGGGAEANIDWTNECVFECQLCQPGRKFNSKEGSTLTLEYLLKQQAVVGLCLKNFFLKDESLILTQNFQTNA